MSTATVGASRADDEPPYGGRLYIADNSVWQRTEKPAVAPLWTQALRNGQIATCPVVRLEVLYSSRHVRDFDLMRRTLAGLRNYPVRPEHWAAAENGIRRLAEIGHHRQVTFPDLLTAAIAETNGIGVLHYDSDFDLLREERIFDIYTEWAAPRGTADEPLRPAT